MSELKVCDSDAGNPTCLSTFINDDKRTSAENLLLQCRLVIKSLLELCMKSQNRVISANSPQLCDLFVVIENILRHGLLKRSEYMTPQSLLSFSMGVNSATYSETLIWKMLERLSKKMPLEEFRESVSCVQQLPTLTTNLCRVRGWIRLLLMQKKLSDHFGWLIEQTDVLAEFYEPWAFLRCENVAVNFSGSLVGLRVIECNLYLKQSELETQPLEIDLSTYVKLPTVPLDGCEEENAPLSVPTDADQKALLDQNNYLEERNRFLTARVGILQKELDHFRGVGEQGEEVTPESFRMQEMEVAMALMEKDVHEKQDTIALLRRQIDDVKQINLDLYQKLRNAEDVARQCEKSTGQLESKVSALTEKLQTSEDSQAQLRTDLDKQEKLMSVLKLELRKKSEFCATIQNDLAEMQGKNAMLEESKSAEALLKEDLLARMSALQNTQKHYLELQTENAEIHSQLKVYEKTLQEMGVHLEQTKLRAEDLKETAVILADAQWESDKDASGCKSCEKEFSVSRRKHHCRNCGGIFCNQCSANTMPLPSSAKPVRVCDSCYVLLLKRFSVKGPSSN